MKNKFKEQEAILTAALGNESFTVRYYPRARNILLFFGWLLVIISLVSAVVSAYFDLVIPFSGLFIFAFTLAVGLIKYPKHNEVEISWLAGSQKIQIDGFLSYSLEGLYKAQEDAARYVKLLLLKAEALRQEKEAKQKAENDFLKYISDTIETTKANTNLSQGNDEHSKPD